MANFNNQAKRSASSRSKTSAPRKTKTRAQRKAEARWGDRSGSSKPHATYTTPAPPTLSKAAAEWMKPVNKTPAVRGRSTTAPPARSSAAERHREVARPADSLAVFGQDAGEAIVFCRILAEVADQALRAAGLRAMQT